MALPGYFCCNACGFFHAEDFAGKCTDKKKRFTSDQLDNLHGEGRWFEIDIEDVKTEPKAKPTKAQPKGNLAERINRITAETDLNGNPLEIGCRVRVFHHYRYDRERDELFGLELDNGPGYFEGTLQKIETDENAGKTGPRYTIHADANIYPGRETPDSPITERRSATNQNITRPVNGTPIVLNGVELGHTFGVFRITD